MKLTIAIAVFGIALPVCAEENATRVLTPKEAIHAPQGTEVTVAFRVKEATCNVLGMVPRGQEPSFQLISSGEDGDASFSVWVAGQLVLDARRLGIDTYFPGKYFNGRHVEVVGTVRTVEPPPNRPDKKPSYQMVVTKLEKFRVKQ